MTKNYFNQKRISNILSIYKEKDGTSDQSAVRDLLTDIMHHCSDTNLEFTNILKGASEVYTEESAKVYYLSPASWDSDSYRDVYTEEEINNLPDDWNASKDDCLFLGYFEDREDAIKQAKVCHKDDMRK